MPGSTGVVLRSSRPAAEVPISTSLRPTAEGPRGLRERRWPKRSAPDRAAKNESRAGRGGRWAIRIPESPTLRTPATSDLMRIVLAPVTTRSMSNVSAGLMSPCASMTNGTRLTMPSRSERMLNRPRPAAALSSMGRFRQQPGKIEQKRPRIGAQGGDRHRARRRVGLRHRQRQPGFTENHARLPQRVGKRAVGARRCADFLPGFLVEVAENVGDHVRRKPVGLGEDDVECDDQRARLGQASDQFGDAGSRPRPLTELSQALLVDVDDDDRALRRDARLQDLEEIECPETELFERCRIGDAQERQRQQQRDANAAGHQIAAPTGKAISCEPTRYALRLTFFTAAGTRASAGRSAASGNRRASSVRRSGRMLRPACRVRP